MSTNAVHAGRRLRVLFSSDHTAGDLVYEKGFYGVVQDNVKNGKWGTLILDGVWLLGRMPANLAMGTKLTAFPTAGATSLLIAGGATTGYNAFGRLIATANASGIGKVQLFNPNEY